MYLKLIINLKTKQTINLKLIIKSIWRSLFLLCFAGSMVTFCFRFQILHISSHFVSLSFQLAGILDSREKNPMDSMNARICEQVTVNAHVQYCSGSPCSLIDKVTACFSPPWAVTKKNISVEGPMKFCFPMHAIIFARIRRVGLGTYALEIHLGALPALCINNI